MASVLLDEVQMKENFFTGSAMLGVASVLPAYRFCWLINKHFKTHFVNIPENTICMGSVKSGKETLNVIGAKVQSQMFEAEEEAEAELHFFPTYAHRIPNSSHNYILYHLKSGKKSLIPETGHLDFLWLIQTADSAHDLHLIVDGLRKMPEVQVVQELTAQQLKKSINNLLV